MKRNLENSDYGINMTNPNEDELRVLDEQELADAEAKAGTAREEELQNPLKIENFQEAIQEALAKDKEESYANALPEEKFELDVNAPKVVSEEELENILEGIKKERREAIVKAFKEAGNVSVRGVKYVWDRGAKLYSKIEPADTFLGNKLTGTAKGAVGILADTARKSIWAGLGFAKDMVKATFNALAYQEAPNTKEIKGNIKNAFKDESEAKKK